MRISKKHSTSMKDRVQVFAQQLESNPSMKATGYAVVFAVLSLLGVLFQEVAFGQIIIIVYGLFALVARVPSEDTFKMALISLICIPILTVLRSDVLAENFAVYAFLLLCFGVASAIREQWSTKPAKAPASAPVAVPTTPATKPLPAPTPVHKKPVFRPSHVMADVRAPQPSSYVSRKNVVFTNRRDRAKQRQVLNSPLS